MSERTVSDNRDKNRYEITVDGEVAGFAEYTLTDDGVIVFTHTEVDEAFEGAGVGSDLARGALDDVRDRGERTVLAVCPFILGWMQRHPDYMDLAVNHRRDSED